MKYNLNDIVYHKDFYNYKDPFKVVGIRQHELELEGNFSSIAQIVIQKSWVPINEIQESKFNSNVSNNVYNCLKK